MRGTSMLESARRGRLRDYGDARPATACSSMSVAATVPGAAGLPEGLGRLHDLQSARRAEGPEIAPCEVQGYHVLKRQDCSADLSTPSARVEGEIEVEGTGRAVARGAPSSREPFWIDGHSEAYRRSPRRCQTPGLARHEQLCGHLLGTGEQTRTAAGALPLLHAGSGFDSARCPPAWRLHGYAPQLPAAASDRRHGHRDPLNLARLRRKHRPSSQDCANAASGSTPSGFALSCTQRYANSARPLLHQPPADRGPLVGSGSSQCWRAHRVCERTPRAPHSPRGGVAFPRRTVRCAEKALRRRGSRHRERRRRGHHRDSGAAISRSGSAPRTQAPAEFTRSSSTGRRRVRSGDAGSAIGTDPYSPGFRRSEE
jgi:hypothetical protein